MEIERWNTVCQVNGIRKVFAANEMEELITKQQTWRGGIIDETH
ncbi:MAG: hypothetical protein WCO26_15740 [Deltaproteobacteria bacterium]